MLRELECRVTVTRAQAAVQLPIDDESQIDLMLTDLVMLGMNGRTFGGERTPRGQA